MSPLSAQLESLKYALAHEACSLVAAYDAGKLDGMSLLIRHRELTRLLAYAAELADLHGRLEDFCEAIETAAAEASKPFLIPPGR